MDLSDLFSQLPQELSLKVFKTPSYIAGLRVKMVWTEATLILTSLTKNRHLPLTVILRPHLTMIA